MEMLEEIEMSYEYVGKSDMTAGNHYVVTLERNGKSMKFDYHTSIYDELHVRDMIECLMMDNSTMQMMYPNYWTVDCFRREFCYNEDDKTDKELKSIMKAIEKNSAGLKRLFTPEELNILRKVVE